MTANTKYFEAVGRRKTASARVRLHSAKQNSFEINGKSLIEYFPTPTMRSTVEAPLHESKVGEKFKVSVKVTGGGLSSQSEAVRHGISRALLEYDINSRTILKKLGFLKRDPRAKERRKFGLKKARKSPQWSKR
jgi:small subunit ribosomal protein S9